MAATRAEPPCSPDPTGSGPLLQEEPTLARKEEEPLMKVTKAVSPPSRPWEEVRHRWRRKAVVRRHIFSLTMVDASRPRRAPSCHQPLLTSLPPAHVERERERPLLQPRRGGQGPDLGSREEEGQWIYVWLPPLRLPQHRRCRCYWCAVSAPPGTHAWARSSSTRWRGRCPLHGFRRTMPAAGCHPCHARRHPRSRAVD
jgi:hypothetical protein